MFKNLKLKIKNYYRSGFTVIELLVVIVIIGSAFGGLMALYSFSLKSIARTENKIQAINLANELLETTRTIRDESWNNIAGLNMGADYYPVKAGSPAKWTLAAGTETQGIFTRNLVFENVSRDGDYNIATSGNPDPDTKKATANVNWQGQNIGLTIYFTNWR